MDMFFLQPSPARRFDIPQVALFADLVDYVDNNPAYTRDGTNTGVVTDKFKLTYSQMYNDLRAYVISVAAPRPQNRGRDFHPRQSADASELQQPRLASVLMHRNGDVSQSPSQLDNRGF
jgi:hypothetical protein